MMKFFLYMMFMFPLGTLVNFWLIQFMMFFLSFMFMILISYDSYFEWSDISYYLGCDSVSFGLIMLTFWICSLMIMASMEIYKNYNFLSLFIFMVLILMLFLFLTFSSMNLLLFYLFFECSLIPTLFLIMGWGLQLDRVQAGMYLLFYTLFASLPFLLCIIYIFMMKKTVLIFMFSEKIFSLNYVYLYFCMIIAFLVKMPMFLVHLWLPKAHVEASISGSMILAGVMLKLGGYGMLRVYNILIELSMKFNLIFISVSMIGGILISLICLIQIDLKALVAYSSVAHMSMFIAGFMTLSDWSVLGSFLLMISHGLSSSGLFCLVNIMYERLGSRSILINKGLINLMPSMTLLWFLLCSSNMSAPPSLSLISEIMLINSLISYNLMMLFLLIFLSFFSASYTLYLYAFTQHGELNKNFYSFSQGFLREYLLLFLHWIPLNFIYMYM